ncbi:nitrogen fixation protein NifB [Microbulbifer sp. EKSA008]|uniref:nitrogen fixation protein NifB n=1 Tax=unclassified Microbulbifer TaxID=2619833 RepID=UPI00403AF757
MHKLASIFALDIAAYAVMSNHTHIVLYIDTYTANSWSTIEIIERWQQLFKGSALSKRYLRGEALDAVELEKLQEVTSLWRERLVDISWFMRCLNESIARQANAEDSCTGRFWEGLFKSQALLDERALAACLAYVDLNPIRASIANPITLRSSNASTQPSQASSPKAYCRWWAESAGICLKACLFSWITI